MTFTRYEIDQGFDRPHGDWSENVVSINPWAKDAFGTSGLDHQVYWWQNDGTGTTWGPRNVIYTNTNLIPFEVAAGDFDNDGDVDAVSSFLNYAQNSISEVYLHNNNGGGNFSTTLISNNFEARARQLRVYNIDNDNDLDIVVAANSHGGQSWQSGIGVYWYENIGGSNPANFTQQHIGNCNPWKIDCFDAEGDGHLEIVATEAFCGADSGDPCRLVVLKNNGAEVFTLYVIDNNPSTCNRRGGPRCKDFNGDGLVDIAAGNTTDGILYWYENQDLSGTNFLRHEIDNNCPKLDGICSCDPEPDGDWDIFAAGRLYWFKWYENDGSGNFTPDIIETGFEQTDLPYTTFLDGDSCCDVVLSIDNHNNNEPGYFFAYLNPCGGGTEEKENAPSHTWLKVPSLISSDLVKLEYGIENKGNVRLEVIDLAGRIIRVIEESYCSRPGVYKTVWNLSEEPNGVYVLRLMPENSPPLRKKSIVIRKR